MTLTQNLTQNLTSPLTRGLVGSILEVPAIPNLKFHIASFQEGETQNQLFGSNIVNGDPLIDWLGITNTTINCNQSLVSRQPIYEKSSVINGRPGVRFDGTLSLMTLSSQPVVGTVARSFFIVAVADDGDTDNFIISMTGVLTGSGGAYRVTAEIGIRNDSVFKVYGNDSVEDGINAAIITATNPADSNHGSDLKVYKDGTLLTDITDSLSLGIPIDTNVGTAAIGMDANATGQGFKGVLGEILIYDRLLSANESNGVLNYLSPKWGLPLTGLI